MKVKPYTGLTACALKKLFRLGLAIKRYAASPSFVARPSIRPLRMQLRKARRHTPTPCQIERRLSFRPIKTLWNSLNIGEQNDWKNFALAHGTINRCGETVYLTAYQMFCRVNGTLASFGADYLIADPPANLNPPTIDVDVTLSYELHPWYPTPQLVATHGDPAPYGIQIWTDPTMFVPSPWPVRSSQLLYSSATPMPEGGWTERANDEPSDLYSITFGDGLFVAVGAPGLLGAYIITSPDGINWTTQANPQPRILNGVTFGDGLFVAVGETDETDAYIITSTNGINWTERANPKPIPLTGVTFGDGLFVAVGTCDEIDAYLITSTNGVNWSEQANPQGIDLAGVTFGDGLYVAVGNCDEIDAYLITSTNGVNWSEQANPKPVGLNGVTFGNGLFVAVGFPDEINAYLITSTNGVNWSEQANPKPLDTYGVTFGDGLYVAVGGTDETDAYVITSPGAATSILLALRHCWRWFGSAKYGSCPVTKSETWPEIFALGAKSNLLVVTARTINLDNGVGRVVQTSTTLTEP